MEPMEPMKRWHSSKKTRHPARTVVKMLFLPGPRRTLWLAGFQYALMSSAEGVFSNVRKTSEKLNDGFGVACPHCKASMKEDQRNMDGELLLAVPKSLSTPKGC